MSLREALETGYDELASAAPEQDPASAEEIEPAPEAADPEAIETAPEPKPDRSRNESGQFAKEKPQLKAKPAASFPPARAAGTAAAPVTPAPAAAPPIAPPSVRAPQSWKPAEREAWASVPPSAQQAILRREKEIATALQQAAESGKAVQPWQEAVRPYEAQIRSAGMEPHAYVGTLLKTAHALEYGQPQARAQLLADLIVNYGVAPEMLDQALVSRMQGRQAPQQAAPQEFRDPRFDQFLQQMEQAKTQRAQAAEQEAISRATAFAEKHEFYSDVQDTMADLLDLWAKQGKSHVTEKDLDRAYEIACGMNDDVRAILDQRNKAQSVRTAVQATAKARAAASSVRTQPTAAPAAQPTGRRAALEAAFDALHEG